MMSKILPALAALAATAGLVVPTVGHAAEVASVRVSYADLNLASELGQNVLLNRIGFAADQLCGTSDPRDLIFASAVATCRTATISDAQPAFEATISAARHGTVTVGSAAALVISAR
jgi:UrcA family protein